MRQGVIKLYHQNLHQTNELARRVFIQVHSLFTYLHCFPLATPPQLLHSLSPSLPPSPPQHLCVCYLTQIAIVIGTLALSLVRFKSATPAQRAESSMPMNTPWLLSESIRKSHLGPDALRATP